MTQVNKQIFISHSLPQATEYGEKLKIWLKFVLGDNVDIWFSGDVNDLHRGRDSHRRIIESAKKSFACISILTPENYKRPWILFEPGIFYGGDNKEVIMLLCGGISHSTLQAEGYPVEGYASYSSEKQHLHDLVVSLNQKIGRDDVLLNTSFDAKIDEIISQYKEIFDKDDDSSLTSSESKLEDQLANLFDSDSN